MTIDHSTNPQLEIRNCPASAQTPRFKFQCPLEWDALKRTDDEKIRYCDQCNRNIHHVTTDAELGDAILNNLCIAWEVIDPEPAPDYTRPFLMGYPDAEFGTATRLLLKGSE